MAKTRNCLKIGINCDAFSAGTDLLINILTATWDSLDEGWTEGIETDDVSVCSQPDWRNIINPLPIAHGMYERSAFRSLICSFNRFGTIRMGRSRRLKKRRRGCQG